MDFKNKKRYRALFISSFRGSYLLNVFVCFMAFSILLVSCTQETVRLPDVLQEGTRNETPNGVISMVGSANSSGESLSEFGSYIKQIGEYTVSGEFSKQRIVDYVNNLSQQLGYTGTVDSEFFDEVMSAEFFLTTSSSMHLFLLNLKEKNKISEREFVLLDALDEEVISAQTDEEILGLLADFRVDIENNTQLTNFERDRMLTFVTILSGVMEPYLLNDGAIEERSWADCIGCINKNKWKIGLWTTVAIIVSVAACAYIQAQTGFPFGICVQAVWLAFAGSISRYCWKECFGTPDPECLDPACPVDFINSFDNGFSCCTDNLEGASIITGQNNNFFLSVLPDNNGNCLPDWTFVQFTETCMKMMPFGWDNLRVSEDGRFCVDANNCE